VPYKLSNARRHKFEKTRYQINNWPAYNEALKNRGSVTLWFSQEIIKAWYSKRNKRKSRGGQFKYSDIAIQAALTIKTVYQLPYRATEGFLNSIVSIMKISLEIPDYSRMCRRAIELEVPNLKNISEQNPINILIDSTGLKVFGAGQWHESKHGLKKRREWRKLHLIIDRDSQAILAQELTTEEESDDSQVQPLLEKIEQEISSISGDTAYDTDAVYQTILEQGSDNIHIAIPPRSQAALSIHYKNAPNKRDHNILFVESHGKYRWQNYSDYHYRALVETAMFRYKTIIGEKLYSRSFVKQKVEAKIACHILNTMNSLGMPTSTKIKRAA
jgi:hypothetical protein